MGMSGKNERGRTLITVDASEQVTEQRAWEAMTRAEKNHQLFLKQKNMLDMFLEHGAITQAQYDKSIHDLTEKMGEKK